LNYDDEPEDQLNQFFDIFTSKNPKITQTANLFLLPKNPHTMLTARHVIENNDIRITPVYNSINQSQTLLLEQWDEDDLQTVLLKNGNL
jgi:hypothetical protein